MLIFAGSRRKDESGVDVYFWDTDWEDTSPVPLKTYLDEISHSPTGFEWGYHGSGPAQLSYALLRTFLTLASGYDIDAIKNMVWGSYQDFKRLYVSGFPKDGWTISEETIYSYLFKTRALGGKLLNEAQKQKLAEIYAKKKVRTFVGLSSEERNDIYELNPVLSFATKINHYFRKLG